MYTALVCHEERKGFNFRLSQKSIGRLSVGKSYRLVHTETYKLVVDSVGWRLKNATMGTKKPGERKSSSKVSGQEEW